MGMMIIMIMLVIKLNNKCKRKKRNRVRMGSWSFKLLSKKQKHSGRKATIATPEN